jgi:hypothetical protein
MLTLEACCATLYPSVVKATNSTTSVVYDEHGFLSIPPCLWGDPMTGLKASEFLSLDITLLSIKRNNNTVGNK